MPEWMMLPEALDPKLVLFFLLMGTVLIFAHRGSSGRPEPKRQRQHRTAAMLRNGRR